MGAGKPRVFLDGVAVPVHEIVRVALYKRSLAGRLGAERVRSDSADHGVLDGGQEGCKSHIDGMRSDPCQSGLCPVRPICSPFGAVITKEPHLAPLATEQHRRILTDQLLLSYPSDRTACVVVDPELVNKGLATPPDTEPELLMPVGLPTGERGRRERYGIRDLGFTGEQFAKPVDHV